MNKVKAKLKEGKTVLGTMMHEFGSTSVPVFLAQAGYEFVFIDTEHGMYDMETVSELVRSARMAGIVPLVRVTNTEYDLIARALDAGAQGLMIPRVESAEQAEKAMKSIFYPPKGNRGCAARPVGVDYRSVSIAEYIEYVNEQTLVVVQLETRAGLERIDEILAVEGADVALIGPVDLSVSLGVPGELRHPQMIAAIERVVDRTRARGLAAGIHVGDSATLLDCWRRGMRFLTLSTDVGFLRLGADRLIREMRKGLGE